MQQEESVSIVVHVKANAKQNKVVSFRDGVLYLRIAAHPTKGKANQELLEFLSNILCVSKAHLAIEKGVTIKKKMVSIKGLTQDQVTRQLEKY